MYLYFVAPGTGIAAFSWYYKIGAGLIAGGAGRAFNAQRIILPQVFDFEKMQKGVN